MVTDIAVTAASAQLEPQSEGVVRGQFFAGGFAPVKRSLAPATPKNQGGFLYDQSEPV